MRLRLAKNGVMFGKKEVNGMVCRIFLFTLHSEKDNVFLQARKVRKRKCGKTPYLP